MALPEFVLRSYAGGAPISYLTAPMGPGDLEFTLSPVVGWVTPDNDSLGTDGPFVIDMDRGLATEEKILCTSVNLETGQVEVYNVDGTNGRGYDQTTAQSHSTSGGSPLDGSAQVVLTAVECAEYNRVVAFILGTQGGSQENGDVLTWAAGQPAWGSSPFLPSGLMADFGGAVAPSGWVLCDGSSYDGDDETYSGLFAVIGTTYGGSGSTFNVPNLAAINSIGQGDGHTVGQTGGSNDVSITQDNLPDTGPATPMSVQTYWDDEDFQAVTSMPTSEGNVYAIPLTANAGATPLLVEQVVENWHLGDDEILGAGDAFSVVMPFVVVGKIIKL